MARALRTLRDGTERSRWPARPIALRGNGTSGHTGVGATHDFESPVECVVNGESVSCADATGSNVARLVTRRSRSHRNEGGMRGRRVRRVHGASRRYRGAVLSGARGPSPRQRRHHDRGPRPSVAAGLRDQFAVQCGFCIPGFLMRRTLLLDESPGPTRAEVTQGLSGNLCRCTGYYRFYDAIEQVAQ